MGLKDILSPGNKKDDEILYGAQSGNVGREDGPATTTGPHTGTTPMHTTVNPSATTSTSPDPKHEKHDKHEKVDDTSEGKPKTIDRIKSVFSRKKHEEPEETTTAATNTKTQSGGPYNEDRSGLAQSSTTAPTTTSALAPSAGTVASGQDVDSRTGQQNTSASASVASIKSGIPGRATETSGATSQPMTTSSSGPHSTTTTTHAPTVTTTTTSSIPTSSTQQSTSTAPSGTQASDHAGRNTALGGAGAALTGGALAAGATRHDDRDTTVPASHSTNTPGSTLPSTLGSGDSSDFPSGTSSTNPVQSGTTTGGLPSSAQSAVGSHSHSSVSNDHDLNQSTRGPAQSTWVQSILPENQSPPTSTGSGGNGLATGTGLAGGVLAGGALASSRNDKDQPATSSEPITSSTNFSRPTPTSTTNTSAAPVSSADGVVVHDSTTYTARSFALPGSTHDSSLSSHDTHGENLTGTTVPTSGAQSSNTGSTGSGALGAGGLGAAVASTLGLGSAHNAGNTGTERSTNQSGNANAGVGSSVGGSQYGSAGAPAGITSTSADTSNTRGSIRRLDSEPLGIPGSFPAETPLSEQPPAVTAATTAYNSAGTGHSNSGDTAPQNLREADPHHGRDAALAGGAGAAAIGAATAWRRHEGDHSTQPTGYTDSVAGGSQPYTSHGLDPRVDTSARTGPLSGQIDQTVPSSQSHGRDAGVAQGTPALSQTAASASSRSADPTIGGQISGSTADNLREPTQTSLADTRTGTDSSPSTHHGRNTALTGAAGAAAGVGAYEYNKPKDHLPVEEPSSSTGSSIPLSSSTAAHAGRSHETTTMPSSAVATSSLPSSTGAYSETPAVNKSTSGTEGRHPDITASPTFDPTRPTSSDNDPNGPREARAPGVVPHAAAANLPGAIAPTGNAAGQPSTSSSTVPAMSKDASKESNTARNVVAGLGGGALGSAAAYHAYDKKDSAPTSGACDAQTAGTTSRVRGTDYGSSATAGGLTGTTVQPTGTSAGPLAGTSVQPTSTSAGPLAGTSVQPTSTSAGPLAGTSVHPTSTSSGPLAGTFVQPSSTTSGATGTRDLRDDQDKSHTGRNVAAGTAVGAGVGTAAALAGSDSDREKELKEAEKQREKEAKEAEKHHKKEEKEIEKQHKKEEKEAEKQHKKEEKEHHHAVVAAQKKEEKQHEKEEKKHQKEIEKEEKKHQKELEKDEKERQKAAEKAEKEQEKQKKGGLLGFLHLDKHKGEELTAEEQAEHDKRERERLAAGGVVGGAAAGGAAYAATRDRDSTTATSPSAVDPVAQGNSGIAPAPGFVSPQNHRDYTQQRVFDPSAPATTGTATGTTTNAYNTATQPTQTTTTGAHDRTTYPTSTTAGAAAPVTTGTATGTTTDAYNTATQPTQTTTTGAHDHTTYPTSTTAGAAAATVGTTGTLQSADSAAPGFNSPQNHRDYTKEGVFDPSAPQSTYAHKDHATDGLGNSQTQHSVTSDTPSGEEKKKGGLRSLFSRNKGDRASGEYKRSGEYEREGGASQELPGSGSPRTTDGAYAHHDGPNKLHKDPPKKYAEKLGLVGGESSTATGTQDASGYRGTAGQNTVRDV